MSILCSMVGASFTVAAAAQILRSKKGITAVGNAQIDTAQSKFGGSSLLLDGTGDYLTVGNTVDADMALTGNNWTVEYWARINAHAGSYQGTLGIWDPNAGTASVWYVTTNAYNGTNKMGISYFYGTNSGSGDLSFGSALSTGVWQHHAFVRNGNTLTAYLNGVSQGTHDMTGRTIDITGYNSSSNTTLKMTVGALTDGAGAFNGHLDEVRISNIARYTANFTPSTTAFVNDANTVLLIHADGTDGTTFFEDDNGVRASRSLIAIGNAQVDTAQSKFGGSALLLDGTGDYVMSPAGTQWDFGTGSFTIEFWIRFNVINTLYVPIALRPGSGIGNGEWWCEIEAASNKMYWGFKNQAGTQFYVAFPFGATAFATGQFYHIALVNNAGTAQLYINGTAQGSSTAFSGSFGNSVSDLWVGAGAGGYSLNGWIDEVRISNSARYTTTFTPSTTAFVNDANTLLLMHCDGTDATTVFRDDNGARASIGITGVNQTKISTAQSQFGGSSIEFDGTDDHLTVATLPTTTGDVTWELWGRFDILPWNQTIGGGNFMQIAYAGGGDYLIINRNGASGSQVLLQVATGNRYGSWTKSGVNLAINTWYHIAVVRSSGVWKAFFNGTELTTFINDSNFTNSGRTENVAYGQIGKFGDSRGSWDGYMDEIRFSNSARYTADFTPPTAPFQNDANTVLLIHGDGSNNSTVFTDDNGTRPV